MRFRFGLRRTGPLNLIPAQAVLGLIALGIGLLSCGSPSPAQNVRAAFPLKPKLGSALNERQDRPPLPPLRYTLTLHPNQARNQAQNEVQPYLEVSVDIPLPHSAAVGAAAGTIATVVTMEMPVWSPGDYHVQHHGRYVEEFQAFDLTGETPGAALLTRHPDESHWQIATRGADRIRVRYRLRTTPPGLFSQNVLVTDNQVFINGPSALMYLARTSGSTESVADSGKNRAAELVINAPNGWKVETPLEPLRTIATDADQSNDHSNDHSTDHSTDHSYQQTSEQSKEQTATFRAPDYDTLADSPIVMTPANGMRVVVFNQDGVEYRVVYFGLLNHISDYNACIPVLRKIIRAESNIMGGPPPIRQYEFLFDIDGDGGGLEHLNACRIPLPSTISPEASAPFVAHEFFHLWNVKRIRPLVLGPFDYIHPPRTHNLWFAEGITEYYANLAVERAGISTETEFLDHLRSQITSYLGSDARRRITADESSFKVWEGGGSTGYGGLSYYDVGELIGLMLDLKIREVTGGQKSLDDVMRLLLRRHAPPLAGYGEDEIRDTVNEVSGVNLSAFYDLVARSTQPLPFAECLQSVGFSSRGIGLRQPTAQELRLRRSWLQHGGQ